MGFLSTYVRNNILEHVLGTILWKQPKNLYVGLSTTDPLDDGSGIKEPKGGGYSRVLHNTWDVASFRSTENTGTIAFPEATSSWGVLTHFFISDSPTKEGNIISRGNLTAKSVGNYDGASFRDGMVVVSFDAGGMGTFLANSILDHIFLNKKYKPPKIYVGLSRRNPKDDGSGILEPSRKKAYRRVLHRNYASAKNGTTVNNRKIVFPKATDRWGILTHFVLFDSQVGGNLLFYGKIGKPLEVIDKAPVFSKNKLEITIT